jgi:hypothetical protein
MQFRQGDVMLVKVSAVPKSAKPIAAKKGRIILAEGEATGHDHSIDASKAALYIDKAGQAYLLAQDGCTLVHQEHAAINIDSGSYRVIRQREYTPQAIRNVMD